LRKTEKFSDEKRLNRNCVVTNNNNFVPIVLAVFLNPHTSLRAIAETNISIGSIYRIRNLLLHINKILKSYSTLC